MKNGLVIFSLSLFLLSCQKEEEQAPGPLPAKTEMNVAYGTNSAQNMDVYLPEARNTSSTKVMVLIHGGGWSGGDKSDFNAYIDTLKKRLPDYAFFTINYRLAAGTSNLFPAQENDVKAALDFIYSKREVYKISEKWVLLGTSAGAHLSMLQAYKYTSPVRIKAVVDFFGPYDLVDMYNNPASILAPPSALAGVVGATPSTNLSLYQQSSPSTFVSATSPPTIILQGGVDVLVSPNQSVALRNKLQLAGVVNQYVFYPTENHGWTGANLTDSFIKIAVFLGSNVN